MQKIAHFCKIPHNFVDILYKGWYTYDSIKIWDTRKICEEECGLGTNKTIGVHSFPNCFYGLRRTGNPFGCKVWLLAFS